MSEIGPEFVVNMNTWERNAMKAKNIYGSHVDWEERFYECPFCGEPIYGCDWKDELYDFLCPVCEDEDMEDC